MISKPSFKCDYLFSSFSIARSVNLTATNFQPNFLDSTMKLPTGSKIGMCGRAYFFGSQKATIREMKNK
jgi:hypothetical protein